MKNTQIAKTCQKCGNEFKVKAYRANTAHYCSKTCWSTRNSPQPRQCLYCGVTFNSRDKSARFCSRSCSRKPMIGAKASAWKGGRAAHRLRSRFKGDLAIWRKAVFQRDNYKCQHCGAKGNLHAHHIKPLTDFPELGIDVSNGITLCVPCHEALHGRKFSTPGKFPKHCIDCNAKTTGRSERCRGCSLKQMHKRIGHKQEKSCPQCGERFTRRKDQIYCSVSCGRKARHTVSNSTGVLPVD